MTELETLERAKMYMEKLANGINPIDGSVIPDADVVNNVRLSRCFFYVADVLRQVIENGGVTPPKKTKKEVFSLSAERAGKFVFSEKPITLSEIVKRINDLVAGDNMTSLTTTAVTDWLLSIGALKEETTPEGRNVKRPTPHGAMLGLGTDMRYSANGAYMVVVYNWDAQQFLLDNIDAAMELHRQKTENQGQPWSPDDDRSLQELYQSGMDIKEIAGKLKRNSSAVRGRLKKLGIIQ